MVQYINTDNDGKTAVQLLSRNLKGMLMEFREESSETDKIFLDKLKFWFKKKKKYAWLESSIVLLGTFLVSLLRYGS